MRKQGYSPATLANILALTTVGADVWALLNYDVSHVQL